MLPINDFTTLIEIANQDAQQKQRSIWAISGCSASGKSTLNGVLEQELSQLAPNLVICIGLDGFHLSNRILLTRGQMASKGDQDTFDGYGALRLLRAFADDTPTPLYFPEYDRDGFHESIGGRIFVSPSVRLMILEGIWLFSDSDPWRQMRSLYHRTFYLDLADELRLRRLRIRHLATDNLHNPAQVDDHIAHDRQRDLSIQRGREVAQYHIEMDKLRLPS